MYPRIPNRILKGASNEEFVDDVIAEVLTMKLGKVMLISNVWSVETSRYPALLRGVWQSLPRHADLRKVSNPSAQAPGSTWQSH
jgi:hypothetical protein